MSSRNREKRIQNQQARASGMEVVQRRAKRRRWEVAAGGIVLALIVALVLVVQPGGDETATTTTTTPPTTTPTTLASAAGKPCVAVSEPLPTGAPEVAIKVGPPPTQLVKEDLKVGDGAVVKPGATVTVDYIGVACSTGKSFDSSYKNGEPAEFSLNEVIRGWGTGIPGMRVGGQRLLGIPADLAYGAEGRDNIAPHEPLWFVVSLLSTK